MLITSYRKPQVRNTIQIEPDHQGIRKERCQRSSLVDVAATIDCVLGNAVATIFLPGGLRTNKEVTTPEFESCLEDYAGPKLRHLHQTKSDRHRQMSEPAGAGPRITYGAAPHFP